MGRTDKRKKVLVRLTTTSRSGRSRIDRGLTRCKFDFAVLRAQWIGRQVRNRLSSSEAELPVGLSSWIRIKSSVSSGRCFRQEDMRPLITQSRRSNLEEGSERRGRSCRCLLTRPPTGRRAQQSESRSRAVVARYKGEQNGARNKRPEAETEVECDGSCRNLFNMRNFVSACVTRLGRLKADDIWSEQSSPDESLCSWIWPNDGGRTSRTPRTDAVSEI
jgi:hypothetical protein